jgi:mRNA deadenylase 3'-5' endonuclease subunit Ccr4
MDPSPPATGSASVRKSGRKKSSVKLVTYNLLSSSLSSPSYFNKCKPEFCDPNNRMETILQKLNTEIHDGAIICLQEVSHKFAGELHSYFSQNDYHFVTACSGNKYNGYMGVGVAVPNAKYDIEEVDITRIADTKRTPKKKPISTMQSVYNYMMKFVEHFLRLLNAWTEKENCWNLALWRHNQMLSLRLKFKKGKTSGSFVVGTYHMPCMFRQPQVMNIHCALSAQHIQKFAKGDPYIFAGDFNIKPDSSMYQLMTTGVIDKKNPECPPPLEDDASGWACSVTPPLGSAYMQANGEEPNFTNLAQVSNDLVPFCDTLDYIFLSSSDASSTGYESDWITSAVEPLPHRSEIQETSFPSEKEPSDHLLLSASLSLR